MWSLRWTENPWNLVRSQEAAPSINNFMSNKLIEIDIKFDKERLLQEALDLDGYTTFINPKDKKPVEGWYIKVITDGYGLVVSNYLRDYFNISLCKPRFYIQQPGVTLPFHKDRGTLCSFNFLLSENPEPILFRDETILYKHCLLNTAVEHSVVNSNEKRILFKAGVFNKTFDEIKSVLPSKLQV